MRSRTLILASIAACGLAGCAQREVPPLDLPTLQTDQQPLQVTQQPVAVREGEAPLAHIFDIGGPVHVMDVTANTQIAAGVVGDRTLVRIDEKRGVIFGNETITPGPLPAGHRYAIFAEPTTENVYRRTVGPAAQIQDRN